MDHKKPFLVFLLVVFLAITFVDETDAKCCSPNSANDWTTPWFEQAIAGGCCGARVPGGGCNFFCCAWACAWPTCSTWACGRKQRAATPNENVAYADTYFKALQRLFQDIFKDQDGFLSIMKVSAFSKNADLGRSNVNVAQELEKMDEDHDGQISRFEFDH